MINVLVSGLHTSLQDAGRFGYRDIGVPVSGAMDLASAAMANAVVGNPKDATVLEFMAKGPVLQFDQTAVISIGGAHFTPKVNDIPVERNTLVKIEKGSIISFGNASSGVYGYLAIQGGFLSGKVLDSASQYAGITAQSEIKKGNVLEFNPNAKDISTKNIVREDLDFHKSELKVYPGPEYQLLSETIRLAIDETSYVVNPNSSRMAYLLDHGSGISAQGIITAPVQAGTVQLTPAGKIIVLMRDGQTTGGYARILQLTEAAINQLAQKRAGEMVRFCKVDLPSRLRL